MPIMIVAFLAYIVCWDATIAPHLTSMDKTFILKFWEYLGHTYMQCLNLHKKWKSSIKVIHNSIMYSTILEQIQDTFLNIKLVNTVYIYDLPSWSSTFLVLFFNECKCAWKNAFFICLTMSLLNPADSFAVITFTILLLVCNDVIKSFN